MKYFLLNHFLVSISVQQSSYYGYTSMLPARYTQAVMVGESNYFPISIL